MDYPDIKHLDFDGNDSINWFLNAHQTIDEIEDFLKEFISNKDILIHPSAKIHPTAILGTNVYIGEDVTIGPYCYIKSNTIVCKGSKIGYMVEIERAIIFENVKIAHNACLGRCIIGSNSNLAFGFVVATKKLNNKPVKSFFNNTSYISTRNHHGCIVGQNCVTGVNVSVMPGATILNDQQILPNSQVSGVFVV